MTSSSRRCWEWCCGYSREGYIIIVKSLIIILFVQSTCSFTLTAAALVYFLVGPVVQSSGTNASRLRCEDVELPVTLYSSLFAMLAVQIMVAVNEEIILLFSARGTVWNDKPRRWIPKLLYLRAVLLVVDVATLAYATWAVVNDETVAQLAPCIPYSTALQFSKGIVTVMWISLVIYAVGFLIYLLPAGCFSLFLLLSDEPMKRVDDLTGLRWEEQPTRLQKILSLFFVRDARVETTIALNNLAHILHNYFLNVNLVPSDILAGLLLLWRHQKIGGVVENDSTIIKRVRRMQMTVHACVSVIISNAQ